MIEKIVVFLTGLIISIISTSGYFGVFLLMGAESALIPIPSEVTMPFAGYLAARGAYGFWQAAFFPLVGTVIGSLLSYWIGRYGGRKFLMRFGRFLLLDETHLAWTEQWFLRRGSWTIFVSRFIPVVRHLISIPAGAARMPYGPFVLFTAIGGFIWNTLLLWIGRRIGERWEIVHTYSARADAVLVAVIVVFICWFIVHERRRRRKISPISS